MIEMQCHRCGALLTHGLCRSCAHTQCAECKPFPPTEMEKKDAEILVLREALVTKDEEVRRGLALLATRTEGEARAIVEVMSCRLGYGHAAALAAPAPEQAQKEQV